MIDLLAHIERISLFHTMEPFFLPEYRRRFRILRSPEECLKPGKNQVLFMERCFKTDTPPDLEMMKRLRERYRSIVFFDGYAAAGTHLLELLPYVDHIFHKSVFRNPDHYGRQLYAKRLFSDYYHRQFGITDSNPEYPFPGVPESEERNRIRLSWNIGLGDYPRRHRIQRIGAGIGRYLSPDLGRRFRSGNSKAPKDFASPRRRLPVHARIGLVSSESVAHQRRLSLDLIKDDPRFLTGPVPQKRYYAELEESKIVYSPFGWGEVCFRDFEAVKAGALLMKQDMSHLDTWPDIYIPYETYVPIAWDCSDLVEKSEYYLSSDSERSRIARNAWERYTACLNSLSERFESLLSSMEL